MLCYKENFKKGGSVWFSDYIPLPYGMTGQAQGFEFFCEEHLPAAQALAHLSSQDVLIELQNRFGIFTPPSAKTQTMTLWQWLRSWV